MKSKFFAMDTWFYNSTGYYPLETRVGMLAELGFDGLHFLFWGDTPTVWEEFSRLPRVAERNGIEIAGVYQVYDISLPLSGEANRKVVDTLERMEGCQTLDLALTGSAKAYERSDPSHDDEALRALDLLLEVAGRRGITIALYPHFHFWMEKAGDALRLCQRLDHPRLKLNFCGFHWFAIDPAPIHPLLDSLHPHLHSVNLSGSRKPGHGGLPATCEPLDEGEMDNFGVVMKLYQLGFNGWYGSQGYAAGTDVYSKLRRTLEAFRQFEERITRHPEWQFCMK